VVIVDGGSTDDTLAQVKAFAGQAPFPLRALCEPGCNIARGRNLAIAAASGEIIAVTDAGVWLEEDWLACLLAPLVGPEPVDVVGGFFLVDPRSLFERALGAVTLPLLAEINPATFNPSSRSVAFRRQAWQQVGGYPEWLDYGEDLVLDFALRDAGYHFAFAPRALAHFRPRSTLKAFFRQYYRYARGDGKADLWLYRHLIRYATYLGLLPLLLALSIAQHPLWLVPLALGLGVMLRTPLRRLGPQLAGLGLRQRVIVLSWVPLLRWTGDIAKMLGYPVGVVWRWRHVPPKPWPKRRL